MFSSYLCWDTIAPRPNKMKTPFWLRMPRLFLGSAILSYFEGLCQRLEGWSVGRLLIRRGKWLSGSLCCSSLVHPTEGGVQTSWSTCIPAVSSDVWFGAIPLYRRRSNSHCLGGRHRDLMMFVAYYQENEATLSVFTQNWNVIQFNKWRYYFVLQ